MRRAPNGSLGPAAPQGAGGRPASTAMVRHAAPREAPAQQRRSLNCSSPWSPGFASGVALPWRRRPTQRRLWCEADTAPRRLHPPSYATPAPLVQHLAAAFGHFGTVRDLVSEEACVPSRPASPRVASTPLHPHHAPRPQPVRAHRGRQRPRLLRVFAPPRRREPVRGLSLGAAPHDGAPSPYAERNSPSWAAFGPVAPCHDLTCGASRCHARADHPLLLAGQGAVLEARSVDGWTPLHLACLAGATGAAQLLLDYGAVCGPESRPGPGADLPRPTPAAQRPSRPGMPTEFSPRRHARPGAAGERM